MKQTAVDYLFEKLWQMPKDKLVWQHYLEKAKQMEKEQIMIAFHSGDYTDYHEGDKEVSELYYKESYESE